MTKTSYARARARRHSWTPTQPLLNRELPASLLGSETSSLDRITGYLGDKLKTWVQERGEQWLRRKWHHWVQRHTPVVVMDLLANEEEDHKDTIDEMNTISETKRTHRGSHRRPSSSHHSSTTVAVGSTHHTRQPIKMKRRVRPINHSFPSSDQAVQDNASSTGTSTGSDQMSSSSHQKTETLHHPETHGPLPDASSSSTSTPHHHIVEPREFVPPHHPWMMMNYADAVHTGSPTITPPIPIPPMMHIPYQLPFFGNWQMPSLVSPNPSFASTSFPVGNESYPVDSPPGTQVDPKCSFSGYEPDVESFEDLVPFTAKDLPETIRMDA